MAKTVLVTGGGRGIGAATAKLLAQNGYDVAVNYQSNITAVGKVVHEIKRMGRKALALQADIGKEADIVRMFEAIDEHMGPLYGLVNNAGITGRIGRLDDASADTIQSTMDINVVGTILCSREAVKRMSTKHGGTGGVIVNVSSVATTLGSPSTYVWYAASKGATDSFTLGLGLEVAREGVRVVGVAAGLTDTDLHAAGGVPDRARKIGATVPLGRAAQPIEIAEAILWMLSDEAKYCTATTLRVGGGR